MRHFTPETQSRRDDPNVQPGRLSSPGGGGRDDKFALLSKISRDKLVIPNRVQRRS
jgi:hypothetical protein